MMELDRVDIVIEGGEEVLSLLKQVARLERSLHGAHVVSDAWRKRALEAENALDAKRTVADEVAIAEKKRKATK
jgi:hypothetical protein